jgi:hypothetical protein
MHDSHQVERQSIEQVISMVTTSKTAIAHKLLSVQQKMNIINMGGMKLKISLKNKKATQELCISMLCQLRI